MRADHWAARQRRRRSYLPVPSCIQSRPAVRLGRAGEPYRDREGAAGWASTKRFSASGTTRDSASLMATRATPLRSRYGFLYDLYDVRFWVRGMSVGIFPACSSPQYENHTPSEAERVSASCPGGVKARPFMHPTVSQRSEANHPTTRATALCADTRARGGHRQAKRNGGLARPYPSR